MSDLGAVLLGLAVAAAAVALVLPPGVAAALWLARTRSRLAPPVEVLLDLPLVLPPTAVGYLLLELLAPGGWLGLGRLGIDPGIVFTWKAAVLASAVMALPLVVRSARIAFEEIDPRLELVARSLGYGRARVLASVTLPLARRGLAAAALLGFGRALGEFGATVIVAGNIPGRTQTLSLAIFESILLGDQRRTLGLVLVSTALSGLAIWGVGRLRRRPPARAARFPAAPRAAREGPADAGAGRGGR